MAPVIRRLREAPWARPFIITTGQQSDLLEQALGSFQLRPDHVIPYDAKGTNVAPVLGAIISKLDAAFAHIDPVRIIAQGDTTSVLAAAIAGFYRQIPFVHVEAGLRTGDLAAPFPEEYHRCMIAVATALHCAPTEVAAQNLRDESISNDRILISGNTVIDALLETAADRPAPPANWPSAAKVILLTAHRRESFGEPLREALLAVRSFVEATPDTAVYFPVHPNPAARAVARDVLSNHPRIIMAEPASYAEIVGALQRCWLVVTDSGGLQEEAPALGKPVLVLRDVTERPEAVAAGAARIVGTTRLRISKALTELYEDQLAYKKMARPIFPYGDGHAAGRIVSALEAQLAPVPDLGMHIAMRQPGGSKWTH